MSPVPLPPADLARLLEGAQGGPRYSVRVALAMIDGQPPPRVAALVSRLTASKRALWGRIADVTGTLPPPDDAGLTRLAEWEVGAAGALLPEHLSLWVEPGVTVENLLLEHVREVVWTAGMIATYGERVRMA
ncbi:hypothetical protein DAETH_23950 [Deinococcus aetherius]|uniref:Uncharacterized protein n=1 Tax=Deinococcus aetherius TaxID=200252 RepID=A0ABM8AFJ5_9DEIO|nr:hypothetical protein [Deinococcus aetherius]BDP42426.1 hypothetical protein DAETH_23950 [Deinococcus aetherius]